MTTVAVIPIKQLNDAKQRLADLLPADQRQALFTCMVQDVLTAVEASPAIDQILIVTSDAAVADLARGYSAEILPEPSSPGLIEAVTEAGRILAARQVETLLFLPGDVPLVAPEELAVVLEGFGRQAEPEFLIVPAADLGGSNCLACSPPDCMEFGFGLDSFRRHLGIARRLGLRPQVAKLPYIGLDIDTPADLADLVAMAQQDGRDCHTLRYLTSIGIIDRLGAEVAGAG
ncbi:MAG: 2-phospho-L-lactate guanylyltransferase [Pseudomonadales bacterium]